MHLHKSLVRMGFQPRDVDRALACVATLADAMDWLCLNASEENLPRKFAPTKGNIQVMLFSKPGGTSAAAAAIEEAKQVTAMEGMDDKRRAMAVGMMEWGFLGGECVVVLPKLSDKVMAQGEDYGMHSSLSLSPPHHSHSIFCCYFLTFIFSIAGDVQRGVPG